MGHAAKSATWAARLCAIALAFNALPARAEQYFFDFAAPDARGNFTIGAPATDAGYFLITNLTFVVLSANDSNGDPIEIDSTAATDVKPGAAFNPTTGAFINHAFGDRFPNVGDFDLVQGGTVEINGASFAAGSQGVSGISAQGFDFEVDGILNISPETNPSPVPELGTWAMLFLGFASLGCFARRGMREA